MMKDINKSTLSLAILGLLSQRPMTGYDLRKVFMATPMGHFSTSPGAVYPALKRLKTKGLITGKVENRKTLRPKQAFTITAMGRALLKQVLLQPVGVEDVKWDLDALILRFAFMGRILGKNRSVHFLEELTKQIEAYIAVLKEHLEKNREIMPVTSMFALEHGIAGYRTTLRWTKRIAGKLLEGSPDGN